MGNAAGWKVVLAHYLIDPLDDLRDLLAKAAALCGDPVRSRMRQKA
jgi:hypothetical protein